MLASRDRSAKTTRIVCHSIDPASGLDEEMQTERLQMRITGVNQKLDATDELKCVKWILQDMRIHNICAFSTNALLRSLGCDQDV